MGSIKPCLHQKHGVSGIDWKHYKHPLPENVYDSYMRCWKDEEFAGIKGDAYNDVMAIAQTTIGGHKQ